MCMCIYIYIYIHLFDQISFKWIFVWHIPGLISAPSKLFVKLQCFHQWLHQAASTRRDGFETGEIPMCLFCFGFFLFGGGKTWGWPKNYGSKVENPCVRKKNQKNKINTHIDKSLLASIPNVLPSLLASMPHNAPPSPLTDLAAERRCHASVFVFKYILHPRWISTKTNFFRKKTWSYYV